MWFLAAVLVLLATSGLAAIIREPIPVLKASDVVFMYEGGRETYSEYGATVLAWGGKPTSKSLAAAEGIRFFGSVGMVTEFAAYHRRVGNRYEEGLCRDVNGNPAKVPWLTDHQHEGVPYWWCCTQQPIFREFIRERVIETVKAGAQGIHIDDHLGTAGGLWLGLCFCPRCVVGFQVYLSDLSAKDRSRFGVSEPSEFNFREEVQRWQMGAGGNGVRKVTDHPLWSQWSIYQARAAASFMMELRALAAETAGHPLPIGANAGLLWPRHLADYQALDLFTAETDHHASSRQLSDHPLFAYRLSEAMGRPYAATASGGDWAYIKEHNLPGLVGGWIALSYAAGQRLMAPHRQWCHTAEKGTHWYHGPPSKFAPLYQFVKRNAHWFDDYRTHADVAVVLPHRSYVKNPQRWFDLGNRLAAANVSYRILVAGDELVNHALDRVDLGGCRSLLAPERGEFLSADQALIDAQFESRLVFTRVEEVLASISPAVRIGGEGGIRALARIKPGSAVIHLVNFNYDATRDSAIPAHQVEVRLNLDALGLSSPVRCRWITPEQQEPVALELRGDRVEIPRLDLWGILGIETAKQARVRTPVEPGT